MYNIEIGRRVLELYNKDKPRKLTPREFFDEVMFPVFFDTDDDSLHLMQVGNSSFFQAFPEKDRRVGKTLGAHKRERHHLIVAEVEAGRRSVSGAIAVGYPASGPTENTAGQVSTIRQSLNADSIALTWIGAACGIGLAGGTNLLINTDHLLQYVVDGWQYYRKFLKENSTFKGRQLETWNGLWVVYGFGAPDLTESYRRVIDRLPEHHGVTAKKESNLDKRPDWFRMFLSLVQHGDMPQRMQAYAYKYGQMNTTLGFLTLELAPIRNLSEVFRSLLQSSFLDQYSHSESMVELRKIFEAHYTLSDMVALGGISIRTLRPAKVEAFMKANKPPNKDTAHYSILIKSWIIAMLNNDQMADLAHELGIALRDIENNSRDTATTKINDLLNAGNKTGFIVAANELKLLRRWSDEKESPKQAIFDAAIHVVKKAEDAVHRHVPPDQVSLFRALAKSEYLMAKHFTA